MNRAVKYLIPALLLLSIQVCAQRDTLYSVSADIGLGYGRYLTTLTFPDFEKQGYSGSVKLMFHPEHLLSLGVESGYHYLYYIKNSNIEASMISVPLLVAASMRIFPLTLPDLELQGGSGVYFLSNNGNLSGTKIYSSLYSFGYHLGASYIYPLSAYTGLGGEFKYYYISKLQDSNISLRLLFSYKFFKW